MDPILESHQHVRDFVLLRQMTKTTATSCEVTTGPNGGDHPRQGYRTGNFGSNPRSLAEVGGALFLFSR